jgi:uncharacterized protein (DUF2252 family)
LALSLSLAARGSDLPGVTTAHMMEMMMDGYESALVAPQSSSVTDAKPDCVRVVMRQAARRTWKHLARERLEDLKPTIPRGERYWPISKEEGTAIGRLFQEESVRQLVSTLSSRQDDARSNCWMRLIG